MILLYSIFAGGVIFAGFLATISLSRTDYSCANSTISSFQHITAIDAN